jgi:hypothetical protein
MDECARMMAGCLRDALAGGWSPEEVRFVLFGDSAEHAFGDHFPRSFSVT